MICFTNPLCMCCAVLHFKSRFVGYYEKVKKLYNGELPPKKQLRITSFKIESIAGNPSSTVHYQIIAWSVAFHLKMLCLYLATSFVYILLFNNNKTVNSNAWSMKLPDIIMVLIHVKILAKTTLLKIQWPSVYAFVCL